MNNHDQNICPFLQYYTEQHHSLESDKVQLQLYYLMSEYLWRALIAPDKYKFKIDG